MDSINEAELNLETFQPFLDKNEDLIEQRLPMRNSILNIQYWVNTGKPPCLSILNENFKSPEEILLSNEEIRTVHSAAISPFKKNSPKSPIIIPTEPIKPFSVFVSSHSDSLSPNNVKKNFSSLKFAENENRNDSSKIRNQNRKYGSSINSLSTFIYDCNKNVSCDSEATTLLRVDTKKTEDFIPLRRNWEISKISELSPEKSTSEEMKELFTLKNQVEGTIMKNHRRKLFTNSESLDEWPQYSSPKQRIFKKSRSLSNNSYLHPAFDYSPSEKQMKNKSITWRKRSFFKKKIRTSIEKSRTKIAEENLIPLRDESREFRKSKIPENLEKNHSNSLIHKCFSREGKISKGDESRENSENVSRGRKEEKREFEIRKFTSNEKVLSSKENLLDEKLMKNRENVESTRLEAEIDIEKLEKSTNSLENEIFSESTSSIIFPRRKTICKTIFQPSESSEESEKEKILKNHSKIDKKHFRSIFAFDSDEEFDMTTIFRTTKETEINNEGKGINFHSYLREENSKQIFRSNSRQKFISASEESESEDIFEADNKMKGDKEKINFRSNSKQNFRSNSRQTFIFASEESESEDIFEADNKMEEEKEKINFRSDSRRKFIFASEESESSDIFEADNKMKEEKEKFNFPSNSKEENSRQIFRSNSRKNFISASEESESSDIFEADNKVEEEKENFNFRSNSKKENSKIFRCNSKEENLNQNSISTSEESESEDIFETDNKVKEISNQRKENDFRSNSKRNFPFNSKGKFISSSEESEEDILKDIFETNNKINVTNNEKRKHNFHSSSKQKLISDSEGSENIIRCKFKKNNRNLSKILHSLSSDEEDEEKDFRFSGNNHSSIKNRKNNKSVENKNLMKRKKNNFDTRLKNNRFETNSNETSTLSSNSDDIFNLRPKKNRSMNSEENLLNSNETKIEEKENNSKFRVNGEKVQDKMLNISETKIEKRKHNSKFLFDSDDDRDIFHLDLKKSCQMISEKNYANEKILSNLTEKSKVKTKIKEDFNNSTFNTYSDSSDDIFILKSRKKGH